jgi:hypothetical protein
VKPQIGCAARLHPGWSDVLRPGIRLLHQLIFRPTSLLPGRRHSSPVVPRSLHAAVAFSSSDAPPGIGLQRPPDCYASCCRARCCLVLLARFGARAGGWCRVLLRGSGSCNLLAVTRSDTRPAAMTSPSELGCGMAASRERTLAVRESTRRRICRGTG